MPTWAQKLLYGACFDKIDDDIYLNGKFVMAMDCMCAFDGEYIYDNSARLRRINAQKPGQTISTSI